MPFFKPKIGHEKPKMSKTQYEKKLQNQILIAEGNPEPVVDVSECNLTEVPSKVYSLTSFQHKEVLILSDNLISKLFTKGCGSPRDFITLRVLDLRNNKFKQLPEDIGDLINLQVLNLEKNQLKTLPSKLGCLKKLITLNVKCNQLTCLPSSISGLESLRTFDLSDNYITQLPTDLCKIQTLDTLIADWSMLTYPSEEYTSNGSTEEVMKGLCKDCGRTYVAPSKYDPNKRVAYVSQPSMDHLAYLTALREQQSLETAYSKHVINKEEGDNITAFEQDALDQERYSAAVVARETAEQEQLINRMTKEHNQEQTNLAKISKEVDEDRLKMLDSITSAEENISKLITYLNYNHHNKMEDLISEMERERQSSELFISIRHEEFENLRKKEILAAMTQFLQEDLNFEALSMEDESARKTYTISALKSDLESEAETVRILAATESFQANLWNTVVLEEEMQKEAFRRLMLQEDFRHQRLMKEISLVEQRLAELSHLEVTRQGAFEQRNLEIITEKRAELTKMLIMLMEQRDERELEIKELMVEMDRHRENTQTDYWLVQYQRLLDNKPEQLIKQEMDLDVVIIKILEGADATNYIPLFARHRMTLNAVLQLTETELKDMGVHELGLRKNIIKIIDKYRAQLNQLPEGSIRPSAPPMEDITSGQDNIVARGFNSECSICLDKMSSVIFLNCGHVCCCEACSPSVSECPLCRSLIRRRVNIMS